MPTPKAPSSTWFDTCGTATIARCHPSHQAYILFNGADFGYKSGRGNLPYGSDGADHKAYDYLKNRIDSGTLSTAVQFTGEKVKKSEMELWQDAFNRFFPDGVMPDPPSRSTSVRI